MNTCLLLHCYCYWFFNVLRAVCITLFFFLGGLFCLAIRTCTTLKLKFFRLNLDISIERNDFSRLNINPECFCFVPIIALSVFVILD